MKKFGGPVAIIVVLLMLVWAVGYSLTWLGRIGERPLTRYDEETRAQTYDTSRQYNQGTNRDIARYCEKMRTTEEPSAKKAVAALIRSTASTFNGTLTDDNIDCVNEAKGF
jgi:hypothetical protein